VETVLVIDIVWITVHKEDRLRRCHRAVRAWYAKRTRNPALTTLTLVVHDNRRLRATGADRIAIKAPQVLIGELWVYRIVQGTLLFQASRWEVVELEVRLTPLRTYDIRSLHFLTVGQIANHTTKRSVVRICQVVVVKPEVAANHYGRRRYYRRCRLVLYRNLYHTLRVTTKQRTVRTQQVLVNRTSARINVEYKEAYHDRLSYVFAAELHIVIRVFLVAAQYWVVITVDLITLTLRHTYCLEPYWSAVVKRAIVKGLRKYLREATVQIRAANSTQRQGRVALTYCYRRYIIYYIQRHL